MIKVTDCYMRKHYLHKNAIAQISEAGVSSQWHGIRAYIKTFDEKTIEVIETPEQITAMLAERERDHA